VNQDNAHVIRNVRTVEEYVGKFGGLDHVSSLAKGCSWQRSSSRISPHLGGESDVRVEVAIDGLWKYN
jgi:hypothetical protein